MLGFLGSDKNKSKRDENVSLDVIDPRDIESHCLISGNLHIRGDVFFSGTLRVDGRIDGKVSIYDGGKGQLILSKGAVIHGPVKVTSALVDGTISGIINVDEKLECRSNAVIRGEVTYGSIYMANGAKLEARCHQHEKSHLKEVTSEGIFQQPLLATRDITPKKTTFK